jgi:type 1 glutamine amidotransferase
MNPSTTRDAMKRILFLAGLFSYSLVVVVGGCGETDRSDTQDAPTGMTQDQQAAIEEALPDQSIVPARQPRSLLIFNLSKGFAHECIPWVDFALARMGEKSGAFQAVVSSDTTLFQAERLGEFDAVVFNNNTGEPFGDSVLRANLLTFVRGGGGLIGLHAATDGFFEWPEFGHMMGAYFVNHPWNEEVTLRIEEPDHPLLAPFPTTHYVVSDEIYQFRDPYSRDRLRVLISLDTAALYMERDGVQREDGDFAVSWIREEGAGRVFYSSLGHRFEIFTDPTILMHWLAGIQYALGDLEADAEPRKGIR